MTVTIGSSSPLPPVFLAHQESAADRGQLSESPTLGYPLAMRAGSAHKPTGQSAGVPSWRVNAKE